MLECCITKVKLAGISASELLIAVASFWLLLPLPPNKLFKLTDTLTVVWSVTVTLSYSVSASKVLDIVVTLVPVVVDICDKAEEEKPEELSKNTVPSNSFKTKF